MAQPSLFHERRPVLTLFPYQREAVDAVHAAHRGGMRRPALAAATGAGKTVMFSKVIEESGERSLVIAHRKELIEQAAQKIGYVLDPADVGIVMAERNQFDAPVVVASIQTIADRRRLDRLGAFGLVVVDEAHHAASPSYRVTLERLGVVGGATKALGVSATWDREDGLGFEDVFDDIVYSIGIEQLIASGHLSDVRALLIETQLDTRGVPGNGSGDFNAEALSRRIVDSDYADTLAAAVAEHASDRTCLVFAPNVRTAALFRDALRGVGIAAEMVSGETPRPERERIVADLRAGRIRAVVNCGVFTEGTDLPIVDCVVMGRPTKSRALYQQMAGRGLRKYPGKANCIAEGQRVLTDHGLVPIEHVTTEMKVWDGVAFVAHQGVVCQGEQEVITYAGLTATPDHKVWTAGGWRTLAECARERLAIRVTGAGRTPLREARGYERRSDSEGQQVVSPREMRRMRRRGHAGSECAPIGERGLSTVCAAAPGAEVALSPGELGEIALHQPKRHGIRALRGARDRVPLLVAAGHGAVGPGALGLASGHGAGSDRQQPALRAGEPALHDAPPESSQYPQDAGKSAAPCVQVGTSGGAVRGRDAAQDVGTGDDAGRDRGTVPSAVGETKRRVWDILNAGPRHRFTVEGLLVSNCLILDLVGNADRLDLQTAASLLGRRVRPGQREIASFRTLIAEGPGEVEVKGELGAPFRQRAKPVELIDRTKLAWSQLDIATFALSAGDAGQIVLADDRAGGFNVIRFGRDRSREVLAEHLDIGYAQGVAEAYVIEAGARALTDPQARWRRRPASEKQRETLRKLRIGFADGITAGEASDLISTALGKRAVRHMQREARHAGAR